VQWEYKTYTIRNAFPNKAQLDQFGEDGWELINLFDTGVNVHAYFKRPRQEIDAP
jgi:hypothetical protein